MAKPEADTETDDGPQRVAFVEWPDNLMPLGPRWEALAQAVLDARPDVLVTSELPFGPWIAAAGPFDAAAAQNSIDLHVDGIEALLALDLPVILSSRPAWRGDRLVNEAIALRGGSVQPLHAKRHLPDEPGWGEADWYRAGLDTPPPATIREAKHGVLLCTELMFTEHARRLGRAGAELIAVPRATGMELGAWMIAGAMAALASGSYVVSSNRVGRAGPHGPHFGGQGFAFAPGGVLLSRTSPSEPVKTIEIDRLRVASAQAAYPCYVAEMA